MVISEYFENQMTDILTSMIKSNLTFFKMQVESTVGHTTETILTCFSVTPESFNSVDVVAAMGKFVFTVINTKMLTIAHIN